MRRCSILTQYAIRARAWRTEAERWGDDWRRFLNNELHAVNAEPPQGRELLLRLLLSPFLVPRMQLLELRHARPLAQALLPLHLQVAVPQCRKLLLQRANAVRLPPGARAL